MLILLNISGFWSFLKLLSTSMLAFLNIHQCYKKFVMFAFFLVNFWSHLLAFLLLFAVISYSSSANEATEPEPGVLGRQDFSGGWLCWEKLESVWASQYEWKITHLCFLFNQITLSYIIIWCYLELCSILSRQKFDLFYANSEYSILSFHLVNTDGAPWGMPSIRGDWSNIIGKWNRDFCIIILKYSQCLIKKI